MSAKHYSEAEKSFIESLESTLESKGFSVKDEVLFTDSDGIEITVYDKNHYYIDGSEKEIGTITIVATGSPNPVGSITEINSNQGFEDALKEITDEVAENITKVMKSSDLSM